MNEITPVTGPVFKDFQYNWRTGTFQSTRTREMFVAITFTYVTGDPFAAIMLTPGKAVELAASLDSLAQQCRTDNAKL